MPNRTLFAAPAAVQPATATATNQAGGRAYDTGPQHGLAQYAVTGTLADTFYADAKMQLTNLLDLARANQPGYVAKVAVYARTNGLMKDAPVALLCYLMTLEDKSHFNAAFPYVLNNVGQLRSFAQMIRSGVFGRKSMGSAGKRAIQAVLSGMAADQIFWQCAGGTSDDGVSIVDLLRLAHPRPLDAEHNALYSYLLDREHTATDLPKNVQDFEAFKAGTTTEVPRVDFRRLQTLSLTAPQWLGVAENMTWNQLRLNLKNLSRHGVWSNAATTARLAAKLRDAELIRRSGALPFSLWSTLQVAQGESEIPQVIRNAVSDAVDLSVVNAPKLTGRTLIMVDSSGSMGSAVTGARGHTSAVAPLTCAQAAGYFASGLVKANPDADIDVWIYDTTEDKFTLNPRDSVATMVARFPTKGGGTDTGGCFGRILTKSGVAYDNVIIVSDNESWMDANARSYYGGTNTATAFETLRRHNANAKIVCWDLTPGRTSQISEQNHGRALNVGGFSDSVFTVVGNFLGENRNFVDAINATSLNG